MFSSSLIPPKESNIMVILSCKDSVNFTQAHEIYDPTDALFKYEGNLVEVMIALHNLNEMMMEMEENNAIMEDMLQITSVTVSDLQGPKNEVVIIVCEVFDGKEVVRYLSENNPETRIVLYSATKERRVKRDGGLRKNILSKRSAPPQSKSGDKIEIGWKTARLIWRAGKWPMAPRVDLSSMWTSNYEDVVSSSDNEIELEEFEGDTNINLEVYSSDDIGYVWGWKIYRVESKNIHHISLFTNQRSLDMPFAEKLFHAVCMSQGPTSSSINVTLLPISFVNGDVPEVFFNDPDHFLSLYRKCWYEWDYL